MQVGEVRPAKADDFEHFRRLAESIDGWNLQYDKQGTKVFSKVKDGSTIRLIKVTEKQLVRTKWSSFIVWRTRALYVTRQHLGVEEFLQMLNESRAKKDFPTNLSWRFISKLVAVAIEAENYSVVAS